MGRMRKQIRLMAAVAATILTAVMTWLGSASALETGPRTASALSPQLIPIAAPETDIESFADVVLLVQQTAEVSEDVSARLTEGIDADAIVAAYELVLGEIYESALGSVVQIKVERDVVRRGFFGTQQGTVTGEGSGFVWSDDGYLITSHHVIKDADRISAIFADGSEYGADLVGSDRNSDLAVLKIDLPSGSLSAVSLGDSDDLRVGQLAVAIGNPFGQEFTMTTGIVSALGRTIQGGDSSLGSGVIQTDAPLNPGNSGGPLLDRQGNVIGINSQIISSSGASAGIGFAVPINTAKRVVPELIASGA